MRHVSAAVEPADEASGMTVVNLAKQRPRAVRRSPTSRIISEFQPDAIEIEESTPSRKTHITLYAVSSLIVALVVWAPLFSINEIVTARGKLATIRPDLVVQPLQTSIIRTIEVSPGNNVGQPLATLDPTFSKADVDALRPRVEALAAAIARIKAELAGNDFAAKDQANPFEIEQARLFAERKAYYAASLQNYDAELAGLQSQSETDEGNEDVLVKRLETMRTVEAMRGQLLDMKVGSRLDFLSARDARLQIEASLSQLRGDLIDLTDKTEKTRAQRLAFVEDFQRITLQELIDTQSKWDAAAEELKKAELREHLVVLTSPADAIVLETAHRSIGFVVQGAETLFTLVPQGVPLRAEVNVDSKDIDEVAVGQSVKLKFDAFPFQKYGTASGVVHVISQDSFRQRDGRGTRPFYRVLIHLTDVRLRHLAKNFHMLAGMTLTAELKAGRRSVISYFLYPMLLDVNESIREP
jgi:hemolysin D